VGLALTVLAATTRAAYAEVRQYATFIDGQQAGSYTMTITPQSDGSVTMEGHARVQMKFLGGLKVYRYSYDGTEVWKGGRLQQLASETNDDGKQYKVSATSDGDGLRVKVNGHERKARGDVWVTTYWRLPDKVGNPIALLDADTGRNLSGSLEKLGTGRLQIGGQAVNCTQYRLKQEQTIDFWYDDQGRLLRQEWVEEGHRAVLELQSAR
jgi:hypothetical protein